MVFAIIKNFKSIGVRKMGHIQPRPYTKKNGESFIIRTAHPEDAEKVVTFLKEQLVRFYKRRL